MQRQYPKQTKVNLNTTQVNKEWCGKLLILQSLLRLDSNMESKASNNSYLNIIKLLFLI